MGILFQINRLEAYSLQKLGSRLPSFGFGYALGGPERLGDYGIHLHTGVKTGVRILEYDLYSLAHEPHISTAQVGVVLTFKFETAPGRVHQPENQLPKSGLTAS